MPSNYMTATPRQYKVSQVRARSNTVVAVVVVILFLLVLLLLFLLCMYMFVIVVAKKVRALVLTADNGDKPTQRPEHE